MFVVPRTGELVADMGIKGASQGNINHLNAAADGQKRQTRVYCSLRQGDFHFISQVIHTVNFAVRYAVEAFYIDISPAGQQQPIQVR